MQSDNVAMAHPSIVGTHFIDMFMNFSGDITAIHFHPTSAMGICFVVVGFLGAHKKMVI